MQDQMYVLIRTSSSNIVAIPIERIDQVGAIISLIKTAIVVSEDIYDYRTNGKMYEEQRDHTCEVVFTKYVKRLEETPSNQTPAEEV